MIITNSLAQSESIWKPQFIEKMNQNICLNCDRFNEVGGSNALRFQSISENVTNGQAQIVGIANPEQCIDCAACTGNYK